MWVSMKGACMPINCTTYANTTGKPLNNLTCECVSGFDWDNSTRTCRINCTGIANSIGYSMNATACACIMNFVWNATAGACWINCPMISWFAIDNSGIASCNCFDSFVWTPNVLNCIYVLDCGQKSNVVGTGSDNTSCICA